MSSMLSYVYYSIYLGTTKHTTTTYNITNSAEMKNDAD